MDTKGYSFGEETIVARNVQIKMSKRNWANLRFYAELADCSMGELIARIIDTKYNYTLLPEENEEEQEEAENVDEDSYDGVKEHTTALMSVAPKGLDEEQEESPC